MAEPSLATLTALPGPASVAVLNFLHAPNTCAIRHTAFSYSRRFSPSAEPTALLMMQLQPTRQLFASAISS